MGSDANESKIEAFLADYKALVLKHGLCLRPYGDAGDLWLSVDKLNEYLYLNDKEAADQCIKEIER